MSYPTELASGTAWNIDATASRVMPIDRNNEPAPTTKDHKLGELPNPGKLPTWCSLASSSEENVVHALPPPIDDPPRPLHPGQGLRNKPKVGPRLTNNTLLKNLLMNQTAWRPPINVPSRPSENDTNYLIPFLSTLSLSFKSLPIQLHVYFETTCLFFIQLV